MPSVRKIFSDGELEGGGSLKSKSQIGSFLPLRRFEKTCSKPTLS